MAPDTTDPWKLEVEEIITSAGEGLDAENINPEVPKDLWVGFAWKAIRIALDVSSTKEEVMKRVKAWNLKNNPRLPEPELIQKVVWAFKKWDSKFHTT
jgi:hypothetical protein